MKEVLISMLISGDKVLVNILREALVDFICWKHDIYYFDFLWFYISGLWTYNTYNAKY